MKVLHVITGLNTGGAEIMLYKLLAHMKRSNHQASVISLMDEGTIGRRITDLGISVLALDIHHSLLISKRWGRIGRLVRHFAPDVIQGWMYHGNLAAQMLGWWQGRPVLWNIRQSLHSFAEEKQSTKAIIRMGAILSRYPQKIIYNAHRSSLQHEAFGYSPNKTVIIANGFDTDLFTPSASAKQALREECKVSSNTILIGLIARYHPVKDHRNFIEAAARLHIKYPNVHFVFVGNGISNKNQRLRELIEQAQLKNVIHLLGERDDIANITSALDIATSCSYAEGFSNTIGEAMSCAVPCVVTDVGDSALLVGETGIVIPPKNPNALALAWDNMLQMEKSQLHAQGIKARQQILKHYSLDRVVKDYEKLACWEISNYKFQAKI